jgi:hypothetical protein
MHPDVIGSTEMTTRKMTPLREFRTWIIAVVLVSAAFGTIAGAAFG